jgi:WD40 repeat protein
VHTNIYLATIKHNLAASAQQAIFSYDGRILALASKDRTVQLWDCITGTTLPTLNPASGPVQYVAFSHNGAQLVSISGINCEAMQLWSTTSGTKISELVNSNGICYAQFSPGIPNLKVLASALKDCTVHLWNSETGKELSILKGHLNAVLHLAFSSDGKSMVSASEDYTLRLWNLEAYKMATEFIGHLAGVDYTIFSADNQVVASASRDKTVRLWNLEGDCLASFQGHCTFPISVTSHQFVLYVKQEDPSVVAGIAIITIRDSGPTLDPVCWLPSNWEVTAFSVSAAENLAAVGCSNGRVCILDISQVAKLLETNESVSVVEKSK